MTAASSTHGVLYIIATPIGNLDDISARAVKTLASVDTILAEDTRHSLPLLKALGIDKPLVSLHAHNEAEKSKQALNALLQGKTLALISDAGTPLISDPGYPLVNLARDNHIRVVPIPGACAMIAALSAAGIASDMFTFAGFLPAKSSARKQKLATLKPYEHTLIFYESTHRITACIDDISTVFGKDCPIVLAKEITKTFERFVSGTCQEVNAWLMADMHHIKGEFVLMIPPRAMDTQNENSEHMLRILLKELPLKQAVKLCSELSGENKNTLYQQALALKNKPSHGAGDNAG